MSWDTLVGDIEAAVLGLAAEAACYYVCTGWQGRLLAALPGGAERYARLAEAGLRLALARGEGSYYSWTLRALGQWYVCPAAGKGRVMAGVVPSSEGSAVHLEWLRFEPASDYVFGSRVAGTVEAPVPAATRCSEECTDLVHSAFGWEQMHNWLLEEGKWAPVAGLATTDLGAPLRLCFDFSGAATPAPAPEILAGCREAGVGLYTELASNSNFCSEGPWKEDPEVRLEPRLDPEALWLAACGSREAAQAERLPGKTVVDVPEDAFQAGDVHEMMKILLLREDSGGEDSW